VSTVSTSSSRARHLWGETWRTLSAATAGALILLAVAAAPAKGYADGSAWFVVDIACGLASLVLLHYRRRWPVPVALVLALSTAVVVTTSGSAGVALISLTTHRRRRATAALAVVTLIAGMTFQYIHPDPGGGSEDWITNIIINVLVVAFCVSTGSAIGARRELVAGLQSRLRNAEREQVLLAAQARVSERARIAREMHDVLAHRISLVAMHSGALAYRTDLSVDEMRESSSIIRDNAHLALSELREVLGVLRDPDSGDEAPPDAPQPTLHDLPDLVDQARAGDGPVDLYLPQSLEGMSELVSRNAFRIIQECLTNRRKHAPDARLTITVERRGDRVHLEARNAIPPARDEQAMPSSGLGLVGLTERAVLTGGELTYGRDRAGDFVVRAWLPWTRDEQR